MANVRNNRKRRSRSVHVPRAGRSKEAEVVRTADRAAAIGRVLLGTLDPEFFEVDKRDYEALPRRNLKSGARDVRQNVGGEIDRFCRKNFVGMTQGRLAALYDAALEPHRRGEALAIPLADFEGSYARIADGVLRGAPRHCTVVISARGLQFMFPEDLLAKDLLAAVDLLIDVAKRSRSQRQGDQERRLARLQAYACRTCVLGTFNLIEAYLNGIAWGVVQDSARLAVLPSTEQGALRKAGEKSLRWKLENLPRIVGGSVLPATSKVAVDFILDNAKPLRDALVHASPFPTPAKYGGHDKLGLFYSIDVPLAASTLEHGIVVVGAIHRHISDGSNVDSAGDPPWLEDLCSGDLQLVEAMLTTRRGSSRRVR